MEVRIFQSGQASLSISINGKPSLWKISNQSGTGVWNLYKAGTHFMPLLQLKRNLAPFIHKSKELNKIVSDFISENDTEYYNIEKWR